MELRLTKLKGSFHGLTLFKGMELPVVSFPLSVLCEAVDTHSSTDART